MKERRSGLAKPHPGLLGSQMVITTPPGGIIYRRTLHGRPIQEGR